MENMAEKLKTFCNKLEIVYFRLKNLASKSSPNLLKKKKKTMSMPGTVPETQAQNSFLLDMALN